MKDFDGDETAEAFGSGTGNIWLDDIKCTGGETNILSCHQTSFSQEHNCKHSEDTGARCEGAVTTATAATAAVTSPHTTGKDDTEKPTEKSSSSGSSSSSQGSVVIPLVVVIIILLLIVVVIVVIIVLVVWVRSRKG